MKKLIMYPGKYFCLMLGIFLFTSSVPVFGQKVLYMQDFIENMLKETNVSFDEFEKSLSKMSENLNDPQKFLESIRKDEKQLFSDIHKFTEPYVKVNEELEKIVQQYEEIRGYYNNYLDVAKNIMEKGVLEELSLTYADMAFITETPVREKLQETFPDELISIENPKDFKKHPQKKVYTLKKRILIPGYDAYNGCATRTPCDLIFYMEKTDVDQAKKAIEYMQGKIEEMRKGFEIINQAKNKVLRETYTTAQIMEYAFKHMSEAERATLGLSLKARDVAIKPNEMAKSIMAYVTEYRPELNQYFPSAKDVAAELKEMTALKRIENADEIAQISSKRGVRDFITDYEKLNSLEQRIVRKGVQVAWGLTALAAVATAAYIVDIAADNHFNAGYTMSNRELATIGKKIENGTANFKERFVFFRSPLSKKFVETDPVYTLSLVQLARDIYAADELLKEVQKAQEQETNDKVEQGVIKNIDKQIGTADFGVGTL